MTATPPDDYVVEVLLPAPATTSESTESGVDVIVEAGNVALDKTPMTPEVVEVTTYPPVGGGYDRVEVLPFTRQGPLVPSATGAQFPIAGGDFRVSSIVGRVTAAPTGSAIEVDILKNGVSIFATPADRLTIASGSQASTVGEIADPMLADGDYLTVMITQVGSTTPGENLVVSIRLTRIG